MIEKRRTYSKEFKLEAIRMYQNGKFQFNAPPF
jgi:transposase-like protein